MPLIEVTSAVPFNLTSISLSDSTCSTEQTIAKLISKLNVRNKKPLKKVSPSLRLRRRRWQKWLHKSKKNLILLLLRNLRNQKILLFKLVELRRNTLSLIIT